MFKYQKSLRPDRRFRSVLVAVLLLWSAGASQPATAADPIPPPPRSAQAIPFKSAETVGASTVLRTVAGLGLVLVIGTAAVYLLRRYLPAVHGYKSGASQKINVLEIRRLTPRTTLFLIECEGRHLLLAQSGDRIVNVLTVEKSLQGDGQISG